MNYQTFPIVNARTEFERYVLEGIEQLGGAIHGWSPAAAMVAHRARREGRQPTVAECRDASRALRAEMEAQSRERRDLVRTLGATVVSSRRRPVKHPTSSTRVEEEAELAALTEWLRGVNAEMAASTERAQQQRVARERRRRWLASAEWRTPLTSVERYEMRQSVKADLLHGHMRDAPDQAAVAAARKRGDDFGARHDRDPWRVADALGAPVYMDGWQGDPDGSRMGFYDSRNHTIHLDGDRDVAEVAATLAHELGHYTARHQVRRDGLAQSEAEARAFAAGLLGIN